MTDRTHHDERALSAAHGSRVRAGDRPARTPQEEIAALRRENAYLREMLDTRAVIEQAKGALILRFGLDDDAAFAVLTRWSQASNIKLHTVADTLVNVVCRRQAPRPPGGFKLAEWIQEQVHDCPTGRTRELQRCTVQR